MPDLSQEPGEAGPGTGTREGDHTPGVGQGAEIGGGEDHAVPGRRDQGVPGETGQDQGGLEDQSLETDQDQERGQLPSPDHAH